MSLVEETFLEMASASALLPNSEAAVRDSQLVRSPHRGLQGHCFIFPSLGFLILDWE